MKTLTRFLLAVGAALAPMVGGVVTASITAEPVAAAGECFMYCGGLGCSPTSLPRICETDAGGCTNDFCF